MTLSLDHGDTRLILAECRRQGLLRNQAAYVLATARWETARTMRPVVEAYWKSESWRAANLRYYPWHGRGYVQLTWEANYRKAARRLGVPLDRDPSLALEPEIAARVLVTGMREGWFTGKALSDYITLRRSGFRNARRIVNGLDRASDIASLARAYDKALLAEGYGVEGEAPPPSDPVEPVAEDPQPPAMPAPPDVPATASGPVPPGLDKRLEKSKTVWSAALSFLASSVLPMVTDWRVQLALVAVAAIAAFVIWRERKRYRDTVRETDEARHKKILP